MWKKIFNNSRKSDAIPVESTSGSILDTLNPEKLPRHVAIIMDGNGRWANGKGLVRTAGHKAGVTTLHNIVLAAAKINLEALTVYAFSTENWKRPKLEVDFLMALFSDFLKQEISFMAEHNVRIKFIGRIDELADSLQKQAAEAMEFTKNNTGVQFNVAVNYGGQDELLRATQKLSKMVADGIISPEDIDGEMMENALDTAGLPPVDLMIRTSGDLRLSNFLLWQAAYAEFWFTDINWPDFTPEKFGEALADFASRERRFGGLKK